MKINVWAKKVAQVLFKINCILFVVAVLLVLICSCAPAHAQDIKVMVIDSGIGKHNLLNSYVQYDSSDNYEDADKNGHGTHVTGIILFGNKNRDPYRMILDPVCHRVKIYSCRYYGPQMPWSFGDGGLAAGHMEIECIKKATREGINIINFSGGGDSPDKLEYAAIKEFTDAGGIFVTAAGNGGGELSKRPYYPASYHFTGMKTKEKQKVKHVYEDKKKGTAIIMTGETEVETVLPPLKRMVVVESIERDGKPSRTSNRDPAAVKEIGVDIMSTLPDNKFGTNSGTSMAAPAFLHKFLLYYCNKTEERKNAHTTTRTGP